MPAPESSHSRPAVTTSSGLGWPGRQEWSDPSGAALSSERPDACFHPVALLKPDRRHHGSRGPQPSAGTSKRRPAQADAAESVSGPSGATQRSNRPAVGQSTDCRSAIRQARQFGPVTAGGRLRRDPNWGPRSRTRRLQAAAASRTRPRHPAAPPKRRRCSQGAASRVGEMDRTRGDVELCHCPGVQPTASDRQKHRSHGRRGPGTWHPAPKRTETRKIIGRLEGEAGRATLCDVGYRGPWICHADSSSSAKRMRLGRCVSGCVNERHRDTLC